MNKGYYISLFILFITAPSAIAMHHKKDTEDAHHHHSFLGNLCSLTGSIAKTAKYSVLLLTSCITLYFAWDNHKIKKHKAKDISTIASALHEIKEFQKQQCHENINRQIIDDAVALCDS
jgi:hypothetical protein